MRLLDKEGTIGSHV